MFEATSHSGKQMKNLFLEWFSVFVFLGVTSWGTLQLMTLLVQVLSEAAAPVGFPNGLPR